MLLRIALAAAALATLMLSPAAVAQDAGDSTAPLARNTLFFEGFPSGTPFVLANYERLSINYDRRLRSDLSLGVGLSVGEPITCPFFPDPDNREPCEPTVVLVPFAASWLTGETHHFEAGAGVVLGHATGGFRDVGRGGGFLWSMPTRVGYRYQPPDGGLFVRTYAVSHWFGTASERIGFGIGVGYTF